ILRKVEEDEAFNQKLCLSESFLSSEVGLVVPEISFDTANVPIQLFEEFVGQRLFVECLVADVTELKRANVRPPVEVEFGEPLGSGAVAFPRPDAESAEDESLACFIARSG